MGDHDKKIRKLRDKADRARQAGQSRKALDLYRQLAALDPDEPRWTHQAAELYRKLGDHAQAVAHFGKAAEQYAAQGFELKAIAMCKVLLAMDPLNATGLELLDRLTGAPAAAGGPGAGGRRASPTPVLGVDREPQPLAHRPTTGERALAAAGGPEVLSPPSREIPAVPRARRPSRETSPRELQSLNLKDIESILEPPAGAPPESAPDRPASPEGAGAQSPYASSLDVPIEIEGYDDVLGGAAAADAPGAAQPRPPVTPAAKQTLTLSESDLEILRTDEEEDGAVVLDSPTPGTGESPPGGSGGQPPGDVQPEELELLDASDLAFMEVLEQSEVTESAPRPTRRPTLERNAPLETLELRDVMAGRERRASQPSVGDLYEVPFDSSTQDEIPAYERRLTPAKPPPDVTPPGLFRALGIDASRSLLTRMSFQTLPPGTEVIRQGDVGGSLYVIVRGTVRVVKVQPDGARIEVSRLSDGEFFGEMALVTDTPRVASVETVTECDLLEVSRDTLRLLIQDFPQVVPNLIKFLKDRLLEVFVKTSELLAPVPEKYRWSLARKFRLYEVSEGKTLIREGKPSGGLFILLAGRAEATRTRRGRTLSLGELPPGSVLGEISLMTGGPATATVRSKTKCWLLVVSAKQFEVLARKFPQMKEYVESLAEERRRQNAEILAAGDARYVSQELTLV